MSKQTIDEILVSFAADAITHKATVLFDDDANKAKAALSALIDEARIDAIFDIKEHKGDWHVRVEQMLRDMGIDASTRDRAIEQRQRKRELMGE